MKKSLLSLALLPALLMTTPLMAQEHHGDHGGEHRGPGGGEHRGPPHMDNRGHGSDRDHRQGFHRPPPPHHDYREHGWDHRPPAVHRPAPIVRPWHGQFHENDYNRWRTGGWRHATYNGRYGWWWVVGSSWYFYNQPVYPYPVMTIPSTLYTYDIPPSPNVRYFCPTRNNYYPYITSCPSPWIKETNF